MSSRNNNNNNNNQREEAIVNPGDLFDIGTPRKVALLFAVVMTLAIMTSTYVIIETGFVGVQSHFGKISQTLLLPGLHFLYPVMTFVQKVETRPQQDFIDNVDCITNEAMKLSFQRIEIGNQLMQPNVAHVIATYGPQYDKYLVLDKLRHQMNVICSKESAQAIAIDKFADLDDMLREFIQAENDKQNTGLIIK